VHCRDNHRGTVQRANAGLAEPNLLLGIVELKEECTMIVLISLGTALAAGLLVYLWVLGSVKHLPVHVTPKPTPRIVFTYALFETQTSCGECAFRSPETCKVCRKS
jgi:hypothetical protein